MQARLDATLDTIVSIQTRLASVGTQLSETKEVLRQLYANVDRLPPDPVEAVSEAGTEPY